MAEWLVEQGIGEERAILTESGAIVAARLHWPGSLAAGQIENAALVSRHAGSRRGTVRFANGEEALVNGLAREASEGQTLRVKVARAAMAESGRFKLANVRPSDQALRPAPKLAEQLESEGYDTRIVRQFPDDGWTELFGEAWEGIVPFDGGSLTISPTPAMTVIDVDGTLPPRGLALAAVPAIAGAIRRFDLAGSIGVDFPTLEAKDDRRAIDDMLAEALIDWPHQRTAMNGFGLVQLVARLERRSLVHRLRHDRSGASARLLLRSCEHLTDPGAMLITCHPAVRRAILPAWEAELARRTGRQLRWQEDPALALTGGFAQVVSP